MPQPAILLGFLIFAPGLPSSGEAPPPSTGEVAEAVSRLGSEDWSERDAAEAVILAAGVEAVSALEVAAGDPRPELSYRARYLLERIDPEALAYQIVLCEAGSPPRIRESSSGIAEGIDASDSDETAASDTRGRFLVRFRPSREAEADISIAERRAVSRVELAPPVGEPETWSILERREEATYRHHGLSIERDRASVLTLFRFRRGRRSSFRHGAFEDGHEALLASLETSLARTLRSGSPEARREALEIQIETSLRGDPAALAEAELDPALRLLAGIAGGDREHLQRALESPGAPGLGLSPGRAHVPLIAAVRLLPLEAAEAMRYLPSCLRGASPFEVHRALSALADHAARSASAARAVLDFVLSAEIFQHLPWDDPECAYLFSTSLARLDPSAQGGASSLRRALDAFETLVSAEDGEGAPGLRQVLALWLTARRGLEPRERPNRTNFLVRVLSRLGADTRWTEVPGLVDEAVREDASFEVPESPEAAAARDEDVRLLFAVLVERIRRGEPAVASRAYQAILRATQVLPRRQGSLSAAASATLDALEAGSAGPASTPDGRSGISALLLRQGADAFARLTGIPLKADRGTIDPAEGRRWLADRDAVAKRELAWLARPEGALESSGPWIAYEFDLECTESGTSPESEPARVLDARRVEVRAGESSRAQDRWMNALYYEVEREATPAAPGAYRLRVNGRATLWAGTPTFASVHARNFAIETRTLSDLEPGSRLLSSRPTRSHYRTVLSVVEASRDEAPVPDASPEAVWSHFLERHVFTTTPDAPPWRTSSVLAVVRATRPRGAVRLFETLFLANPSCELARDLYAAGDPRGLAYLEEEAKNERPERAAPAAATLASLARPGGAMACLSLAANPEVLRRYQHAIFTGLDAYLERSRAGDETRERVFDFLFARADDPAHGERALAIIERECGPDSGLREALSIDGSADPTRRRSAIEESIRKARASSPEASEKRRER